MEIPIVLPYMDGQSLELRDEGFSEQEIDELISLAGFGVLLNTMTDIVHIPTEEPLRPAT